MTKEEAIAKWKQAAGAESAGKSYVRAGNWEPIAHALRHCSGEAGEIETLSNSVIRVTAKPPADKESAKPRPPFVLIVE